MAKLDNDDRPYIGSYVLETLTTGMYGESRNALREYVQNSFDAIRAAVSGGALGPDEGRIHVLVSDANTIVIADNGMGLSVSAAFGTLTAVGASKKNLDRDAGFRGIGRLAGIAFCNTLTFSTKTSGEDSETVVTFNCRGLRKGMSSDGGSQELVDLLQEHVKVKRNEVGKVHDHYMVVTLRGLSLAPPEFKDLDLVRDYLAETSPIAFDPNWERGVQIEAEAQKPGKLIEHTALYVGRTRETATPVYKAYSNSYAVKGDTASIAELQYHHGADSTWWAWVALPDKPAIISDAIVHGLRIRVKNIQIDGTRIFDELFAKQKPSYERFNKYYVGEVYIDAGVLVPNARRDGFEDNAAWTMIKGQLLAVLCKPLATRAYDLSKHRQQEQEVLERQVARLVKAAEKASFGVDAEKRTAALKKAYDIRKRIASALEDADSETKAQLKSLIESVDLIRERLSPANPNADLESHLRAEIKKEVVAKVLSIIEPHLEPRLFILVKRALNAKS